MYRLNVQQTKQTHLQHKTQQSEQSQHLLAEQYPNTTSTVIPSHIFLQQQLNGSSVNADTANTEVENVFLVGPQAASDSAECSGNLPSNQTRCQSTLIHIQQQQQQQQQQSQQLIDNSSSDVVVGTTAISSCRTDTVLASKKLQFIATTPIKSEPSSDVITLTSVVNNRNNVSCNMSSTNVINNPANNSNNNEDDVGGVGINITEANSANTISMALTSTNSNSKSQTNPVNIIGTLSKSSSASQLTVVNSAVGNNGGNAAGLTFVPTKRNRLEVNEEWISTSSPGSVPCTGPPLSPSPGSQNQMYGANMSNGYSSPMSAGSYDPFSPNGKTGRDDLSPSSSLNGFSTNDTSDGKKIKKGPAPRLQEELCLVCGDRASGYHYNALTCEGCKGFFRRSVTKNAVYCCKFGHACEMDMYMRRKCQECRLKKCLAVGMRPECVVPENQCAMKRREKKAQKEKDKLQTSTCNTDFIKKEILDLMTCEPPSHPTAPLLPDDILAKCQARNIPPLTFNQLAVIYKLIWYQDGYEQPSEEDLKRIMSSPDENESQHDVSFRHITEITILTVQLIVEFAKGLPAFTKIPQEDQITLLKACSSEVMMLRMARRYDHNSDSIFFANNRSYTRDSYKMAGMADNIEDLLHFCRQMYSMKVDNVEYALLTAIVIFSDRPGLEKAELVEAIQSYYIDTLRIYILNRHCGDPMSLVFFAKLLSILTELRTLGNQNAEMCFSLKLKNRKLPKFLEEIWDVHAIPPSVQSHIQATQAEKAAQESATTSSNMSNALTAATTTSSSINSTSSSAMSTSTSPPTPVAASTTIITPNGYAYNSLPGGGGMSHNMGSAQDEPA